MVKESSMKLLQEMNAILEAVQGRTLDVNGYSVRLEDWEAKHGYHPGQLLFHATHDDPEEYSDDESSHLTIVNLVFEVKSANKDYVLSYDLDDKDYHENANRLYDDLSHLTPEVHDGEDDKVTDQRTIIELKKLVTEYAKKFKLLDFLYENGSQHELEHDNDSGYDYHDDDLSNGYDGH